MTIDKHEFPAHADGLGRKWCLQCGALHHGLMTATCVTRRKLAPEPRCRVYAMQDVDAIYARIQELRAQPIDVQEICFDD